MEFSYSSDWFYEGSYGDDGCHSFEVKNIEQLKEALVNDLNCDGILLYRFELFIGDTYLYATNESGSDTWHVKVIIFDGAENHFLAEYDQCIDDILKGLKTEIDDTYYDRMDAGSDWQSGRYDVDVMNGRGYYDEDGKYHDYGKYSDEW